MDSPIVTKNRFGYYELTNKPSARELSEYYARKYYQNDKGLYQDSYPDEDICYFRNKVRQKYEAARGLMSSAQSATGRFLDVGAGEGWALSFFDELGWDSTGLDFSDHGCRTHNPAQLEHLVVGDIFQELAELPSHGTGYNIILLDNVLEHVLSPLKVLTDLSDLIAPNGVLIIEVPNDFSVVQQHLLKNQLIPEPFWIAIPDHISYFNRYGLEAVCREAGWTHCLTLGDYPIDFDLFNERTNYVKSRDVGKASHRSRVAVENMLHEISIEKTNNLYRALGDLGLGREIIGFYQRSREQSP